MFPSNFFDSSIQRIHHRKYTHQLSNSTEKQTPSSPFAYFTNKRKSAFDLRKIKPQQKNQRTSSQTSQQSSQQKEFKEISLPQKHINLRKSSDQFRLSSKTKREGKIQKRIGILKAKGPELKSLSRETLIKSKEKLQKMHEQAPKSQTIKKEIRDYAKYINSTEKSYFTQVNFQLIRSLKAQPLPQIQSGFKLLESVIVCLVDNIKGSNNQFLIMEYCNIYFQSVDRHKMQAAINYFYFKNFLSKIKNVYVYHRIFLYFIFKLAEKQLFTLEEFQSLAINAIEVINQTFSLLVEISTETFTKSGNYVIQGFRTLKNVRDFQKHNETFNQLMKQLDQLVSPNTAKLEKQVVGQFKAEVFEIITNFKPFLGEGNYFNKFQQFLVRTEKIISWRLLKIPPVPFLPEFKQKKYTVVIGLNETLVYYNFGTRILKYRPYMDIFLQKISTEFQLIIFSDFQKEITDKIVNEIQCQNKFFRYRLYRTHMTYLNGKIIKDITKIGRQLSSTLLLDANQQLYSQYGQNGITISSFKPSPETKVSTKQNSLLVSLSKAINIIKDKPIDVRFNLAQVKQLPKIPEVSSLQEKSLQIHE